MALGKPSGDPALRGLTPWPVRQVQQDEVMLWSLLLQLHLLDSAPSQACTKTILVGSNVGNIHTHYSIGVQHHYRKPYVPQDTSVWPDIAALLIDQLSPGHCPCHGCLPVGKCMIAMCVN